MKKYLVFFFAGLVLLVAIIPYWPCRFTASPACKLRIIDESGRSIANVVVERSWNTSERQKDKEEQTTDAEGWVQFDKETGTVPLMGRLVRPLAVFLPMVCGPGSEFYTHTTFRIFWPNGYTLKFDNKEWRQAYNVYCNRERIFIRDPQSSQRVRRDSFAMVTEPNGGFQLIPTNWVESYVELYFSNRERDFDFTLQIHKAETR